MRPLQGDAVLQQEVQGKALDEGALERVRALVACAVTARRPLVNTRKGPCARVPCPQLELVEVSPLQWPNRGSRGFTPLSTRYTARACALGPHLIARLLTSR